MTVGALMLCLLAAILPFFIFCECSTYHSSSVTTDTLVSSVTTGTLVKVSA